MSTKRMCLILLGHAFDMEGKPTNIWSHVFRGSHGLLTGSEFPPASPVAHTLWLTDKGTRLKLAELLARASCKNHTFMTTSVCFSCFLSVLKNVDLQCKTNNEAHHTNEISVDRLIVRRGEGFTMTLDLQKPFDSSKDQLIFTAATGTALIYLKKTLQQYFQCILTFYSYEYWG